MANPFAPAQVDFSMLAKLPDLYSQGMDDYRKTKLQNDLTAAFGNGQPFDYNKAQSILWADDPETAAKLQLTQGGVYGTPIYGKDENGNTVLGAISKNGTFTKLDTGGVTPTPPQYAFEKGIDPNTGLPSVVPMSKFTGQPGGQPIPQAGTVPEGYKPDPNGNYVGLPGTPQGQNSPAAAKGRMSSSIGTLGQAVTDLYENGGLAGPGTTSGQALSAYIGNTQLGQEFGKAFNTKNQSLRNTINATIPLVLSDLKSAAGLTGQQMNSNVELSFYQQAAGGGNTDVVSRLAAIDALDRTYGTGHALDNLPAGLLKSVRQRADAMSAEHPLPDLNSLTTDNNPMSGRSIAQPTGAGAELPATIAKVRQALEMGHSAEDIQKALEADGTDPAVVQQIMSAIQQGP